MIKDTHSLLKIEESLDCLNGAIIFMSLDLKAGYWQVEMEENSIPYTAFTLGLLRFYESNPKKIAAIVNWPQPRNIMQVHSFIGFCNYRSKFIKGNTQIARPLY